jgi:hypothetical protein
VDVNSPLRRRLPDQVRRARSSSGGCGRFSLQPIAGLIQAELCMSGDTVALRARQRGQFSIRISVA